MLPGKKKGPEDGCNRPMLVNVGVKGVATTGPVSPCTSRPTVGTAGGVTTGVATGLEMPGRAV